MCNNCNNSQYSYADRDEVSDRAEGRAKPPFGYYGAKQRISTSILRQLPPHSCWVEAFCGSAAITFAKAPSPIEIINDLDGEIVNVFEQIRNNTYELCKAVALTPYAREEFYAARNESSGESPLERARIFLVKTMMTVNGTVGRVPTSGFSLSNAYTREGKEARVNRWFNLPERLAKVAERLRCVRVENRDARELISLFRNRPATLIYLDPPYLVKRGHGYLFDAREEEFHRCLLEECARSNAMILLSSYENEFYDSFFRSAAGWTRSIIKTSTRDTKGKDYERIEVLWKNSWYVAAEAAKRPMLRLTRKETSEGKVNPERQHRSGLPKIYEKYIKQEE